MDYVESGRLQADRYNGSHKGPRKSKYFDEKLLAAWGFEIQAQESIESSYVKKLRRRENRNILIKNTVFTGMFMAAVSYPILWSMGMLAVIMGRHVIMPFPQTIVLVSASVIFGAIVGFTQSIITPSKDHTDELLVEIADDSARGWKRHIQDAFGMLGIVGIMLLLPAAIYSAKYLFLLGGPILWVLLSLGFTIASGWDAIYSLVRYGEGYRLVDLVLPAMRGSVPFIFMLIIATINRCTPDIHHYTHIYLWGSLIALPISASQFFFALRSKESVLVFNRRAA